MISETVSKKRGRPKGVGSKILESSLYGGIVEGCHKTKVAWAFMLEALRLVRDADEDSQRVVWGWTASQIEAGGHPFPKGWKTAAPEIGRYIIHMDDIEKRAVLNVIVNARKNGRSWPEIQAHYRTLRLGEKCGNANALTTALCRAVNEYQKRFPKTSRATLVEAAYRLLAALEQEKPTTSGNQ